MARAEIEAGNCGYHTTVIANKNDSGKVELNIESGCKAILKMADNLQEVEPFNEISFRRGMPETLSKGAEFCTHSACPVPVGIIKAIEVAAGLNLPGQASIDVTAE